ncbi:ankyrin repeat domain-containing protein [Sphingomonas sp. PR090111-T3T-6A]|uniref:ankyrin repeat domain-containing protein n=1 Tax=Sphingomonas sp. PR090111-T3T-6A TaxID=685778 RepID=UPI000373EB88|nr:ankyrin repeat domain-containing protein [Sphingomonas sp. PR090111-T3T-6A]
MTDIETQMPSPERLQELLFAAARMGRDDIIPDLLRAGADIEGRDARGYTALILASYKGQESTTGLLLSLGAHVDAGDSERGNTALMGISFKGYPAIARVLLAGGADVNARNAVGQTALMTAVLFNQAEIIDLLVEAGADPAVADLNGNTVVTLARMQGHHHLAARFGA